MKYFINLISFLSLSGCGLTQPYYEDYTETTATGPVDSTTECGQLALASYTTNIAPAVDGTCSGSSCHGSGGVGSGKLPLTANANEANRIALFNYTGLDKDKLLTYIESSQHSGSASVKGLLTTEKITTWLTQEETCLDGA